MSLQLTVRNEFDTRMERELSRLREDSQRERDALKSAAKDVAGRYHNPLSIHSHNPQTLNTSCQCTLLITTPTKHFLNTFCQPISSHKPSDTLSIELQIARIGYCEKPRHHSRWRTNNWSEKSSIWVVRVIERTHHFCQWEDEWDIWAQSKFEDENLRIDGTRWRSSNITHPLNTSHFPLTTDTLHTTSSQCTTEFLSTPTPLMYLTSTQTTRPWSS